jgi:hypothetical protein
VLKNTMLRCRSIASLQPTASTLVDFSRASHLDLLSSLQEPFSTPF